MKWTTLAAAAATSVLAFSGCAQRPSYADRCVSYGYEPGTQLFLNCIGQQQQAAIQAIGMWQANMAATRPQTIYIAPCTIYSQIARVC